MLLHNAIMESKVVKDPSTDVSTTSSNTSRANQDNTPRINRGTGYDNQRVVNVARARENVGTQVVQQFEIWCYNCKEYRQCRRECHKPKVTRIAALSQGEMLLCKQEEAGIHLSAEQAVWRDDTDDEPDDQELEAHYIKNRNKFLETSNKALVDKLKGEIEDFKTKNKSLESSNNHFKEANNELSKTNQLMFKDLKKFQDELDRYHDVNYASNVEINCAKAKGDLMEYYYVDHMNAILGVYTTLDEFTDLQCDYVNQVVKCERLEKELSKSKNNVKKFLNTLTHVYNLELCFTQQCQEQKTNDKSSKENHQKTKMPMVVPISTREPKRTVNQSVATTLREILLTESTKSETKKQIRTNMSRTRRDNSIHRRLWVLKAQDEKSQASKKVLSRGYYVEGLNHNLFSVGQFCDADLEVAFWKSTCYIRDLKGNDLLTGSRGTYLYSITLQDTSTPNPICLMAKASSSQAWLWHHFPN
ncbi:hypothetical protein Tco_0987473 [Tanacetum coccineum]